MRAAAASPLAARVDNREREVREHELQQRGERVQRQRALRDRGNPPLDSRLDDRQIAGRVHRDVDRRQQRHRRHVFAERAGEARHVGADQRIAERRGDRRLQARRPRRRRAAMPDAPASTGCRVAADAPPARTCTSVSLMHVCNQKRAAGAITRWFRALLHSRDIPRCNGVAAVARIILAPWSN